MTNDDRNIMQRNRDEELFRKWTESAGYATFPDSLKKPNMYYYPLGEKMGKQYSVYLAGPMQGLTLEEANDWRVDVANKLFSNITVRSPLRGKVEFLSKLKGTGDFDRIKDNHASFPLSTIPAIIGRDRWDATTCDILVVNFLGAKKVSMGTVMEIAWADLSRTPIMLIMEDEGNVHEHGMVTGVATWRVNNIDDAITYLNQILVP